MIRQLLIENLSKIGPFLINKIITELKNQGHVINVRTPGFSQTGEDSFTFNISESGESLYLEISANSYIIDMDTGTPANEIDWDPLEMLEYGRIIYPGLSEGQIIGRLIGLRNRQRMEGSPTQAAFSHTMNGRRTNWSENFIKDDEQQLQNLLGLFEIIDRAVQDAIRELSQAA